eukprot:623380-Prorocentrum_minimum.AAC.7
MQCKYAMFHFEVRSGRGEGTYQGSRQVEAHHGRQHHAHRLAEHDGLRLDAAHAPAGDAEPVDHGGVAVGAHHRVGVEHLRVREHHTGEVLQVHLVHDAGAWRHNSDGRDVSVRPRRGETRGSWSGSLHLMGSGGLTGSLCTLVDTVCSIERLLRVGARVTRTWGHDGEVLEGLGAPLQEGEALVVALEFDLRVLSRRAIDTGHVDLHAVVDHEIYGHLLHAAALTQALPSASRLWHHTASSNDDHSIKNISNYGKSLTWGLISSGLPPRVLIASRIAARSTTQGTPVKS